MRKLTQKSRSHESRPWFKWALLCDPPYPPPHSFHTKLSTSNCWSQVIEIEKSLEELVEGHVMSLEIVDIWVGCSKLKSTYCQCMQHGIPKTSGFHLTMTHGKRCPFHCNPGHTHTPTYIVSQMVPILTMLDGHCSIRFYSLSLKKILVMTL